MPPSYASITYSHASTGSVVVSDDVRSTRHRIFLWMPSSEPSQRSRFFSSSLGHVVEHDEDLRRRVLDDGGERAVPAEVLAAERQPPAVQPAGTRHR